MKKHFFPLMALFSVCLSLHGVGGRLAFGELEDFAVGTFRSILRQTDIPLLLMEEFQERVAEVHPDGAGCYDSDEIAALCTMLVQEYGAHAEPKQEQEEEAPLSPEEEELACLCGDEEEEEDACGAREHAKPLPQEDEPSHEQTLNRYLMRDDFRSDLTFFVQDLANGLLLLKFNEQDVKAVSDNIFTILLKMDKQSKQIYAKDMKDLCLPLIQQYAVDKENLLTTSMSSFSKEEIVLWQIIESLPESASLSVEEKMRCLESVKNTIQEAAKIHQEDVIALIDRPATIDVCKEIVTAYKEHAINCEQ